MKSKVLQTYIPFLGLIVVIGLFAIITGGGTLTGTNIKQVVNQSFTVMIACAGVVFVMSMGSLDFSQGAILAIASYCAGWVTGVNIILGLVASIVVGFMIGCLNGWLNAKFKIPSFIVTICTMLIFRSIEIVLAAEYPPRVPNKIFDYDSFELKLIVVVILLIIGFILFEYTRFGKQTRAIGAGEIAAAYSGVKVNRIKILAFAVAGAMAGVAAFFTLARTGLVTSSTGNLQETNVMIALVLGGLPVSGGAKSRFSSVIVGALLISFLLNGLVQIGVDPVTQQLIKGVIFLIVIIITTDRRSDLVSK
jgi:ribose transport system permease protein